ncbi:hypothetical protein [Marinobacter sediminum]|uniref:hypothetical protein n=1 Tax=Marinobacter sediminum TaxID=256323 RepID=UPI00356B54DA
MDAPYRPLVRSRGLRWLLLGALLTLTQAALSAPKIVLNQSVEFSSLDSAYLNQIFAMQIRKWPDGQAIQVFILPSTSSLHRKFVIDRLQIQAHQLDRIWNRMLFTGTGKAPTVVDSEDAMLKMIRTTQGAIGYVSDEYPTDGVNVLGGDQR